MCNPADETPTVTGTPSDEAINADARTTAQRNHDAFTAMTRCAVMSGELGSHQGLPVTITATVEVKDLEAKAGTARTGGGALLPVKDLIRMAAHASNFLLIFDNGKPLELYKGRSTRLATPAQRLVLYATERGCTHPGCDVPAYWCQAHHATKDWAKGGQTNIDELTLGCGPHNRDVKDSGWTTRKLIDSACLRGVRPGQGRVARLSWRLPRRYPGGQAEHAVPALRQLHPPPQPPPPQPPPPPHPLCPTAPPPPQLAPPPQPAPYAPAAPGAPAAQR